MKRTLIWGSVAAATAVAVAIAAKRDNGKYLKTLRERALHPFRKQEAIPVAAGPLEDHLRFGGLE
jgi:hypothetical protein